MERQKSDITGRWVISLLIKKELMFKYYGVNSFQLRNCIMTVGDCGTFLFCSILNEPLTYD